MLNNTLLLASIGVDKAEIWPSGALLERLLRQYTIRPLHGTARRVMPLCRAQWCSNTWRTGSGPADIDPPAGDAPAQVCLPHVAFDSFSVSLETCKIM